MKRFITLAAISLALAIPGSAYANSITSTITASGAAAGNLAGTVTVDTTAGTISSIALTLTQGTTVFSFNNVYYQTTNAGTEYYFTAFTSGPTPEDILVAFNIPSLSAFTTTTAVCTTASSCGPAGYNSFSQVTGGPGAFFTAGTPAATPEPSSLVLLGTGVLGLAGAARRRFLAA